MHLPVALAILLGVVQGITEFLPISSDGHLALAQLLFGGEADLATTVVLHLGTFAATLLVLRKRVAAAVREGVRGLLQPSLMRETPGGRDAFVVILASIPTALVALTLKKPVEEWSSSPTIVGVCLLLSAVAVGSTHVAPRGQELVPSPLGAVLVGFAQGAAVLPGLSRSAMTIASLLWLGVRADRAFELSFLMSLPAVFGAIVLEGRHGFDSAGGGGALLLGTLVSFGVGILALLALRRVLVGGKLAYFTVYLVPLAVATVAWGYARP
ncbi:undecaprenyl-diphosphate phosphatase [Pendulispora albinea]|uniref:Undecaprenyl-diphosphatase n=1 Tax=Pendulispora albinea TaxID=2741071 RepID=A0ABZ2M120_9BACT